MDEDLLKGVKRGASRKERLWLTTADYLSSLTPELEDAAYRAAIMHWFNDGILSAISGAGQLTRLTRSAKRTPVPDTGELYRQLQSFPFVEEYAGRGHNFHSLTRQTVLDHLWQEERDFYRSVSAAAATYFGRSLDKEGADLTDLIERAYHLLVADEQEGLEFTSSLIVQISEFGYFDAAHALIEAVQEQVDGGRVSDEIRWTATVWRAGVQAAAGGYENVVRMADELDAVGDETKPEWVQAEMARLAGRSLASLGQFDEAHRWLQRARDHEEPGSPSEAVSNLVELGRLFHSWNRHSDAEAAYLDALDRYVPMRLLPLRRVERHSEDDPEGEPQIQWTVASAQEAEHAVPPPRVQARRPEAWSKDQDNAYYVAVSEPADEGNVSTTSPSAWPVAVDDQLAEIWVLLALLYEAMDNNARADICTRLGGSIANDVGDDSLAAAAAQLVYRLGAKVGDPKVGRAVVKSQKTLLEAARQRGDLNAQATALLNLGDAYTDMLDLETARKSLVEALQLSQEMKDLGGQADALDRLAGLDWTQGRDADAAIRFDQALGLLRGGGLLAQQASLLVRIASFHLSRHRPDEAMKLYEEALSQYQKLRLPAGEFDALRGLGDVAKDRIQFDEAARRYEEAISVAKRMSSQSREADGLADLAQLQGLRSDHRGARENYQRAVDLAKSFGDRVREAELLLGIGDISLTEGLLGDALETYRRARDIYAGLKRPSGELTALFGILAVHTAQGHTKRAIRTADAILSMANKAADRDLRVRAYRDAALAYSDAGQHKRATELIREAAHLDPDDPGLLGSLSWVLVVAGDYEEALKASERALAADSTLAWVINNRALALLGLGRSEEGLAAYRLAVRVRPQGEDFGNDIKALERFMREHPASYEGKLALRLLQEEQAKVKSKANSRSD